LYNFCLQKQTRVELEKSNSKEISQVIIHLTVILTQLNFAKLKLDSVQDLKGAELSALSEFTNSFTILL